MDIKENIASSFMNLAIKEHASKIPVKQICEAAHISRTTFYKYFKDVYDVIEYIIKQDAMQTLDLYVKNRRSGQMIMANWFASFYAHKNFYRIAITESGQNSFFETVLSLIEEYNIVVFKPLIKDEQELAYCAYKYSALQVMLLRKWILDGMKISPEELAHIHMKDYLRLKFTDG